jgi:hypothetical protein
MTSITDWIIANMDDDMLVENARKSAYLQAIMSWYSDPTIERITYAQPNVSTYAAHRQAVLTSLANSIDKPIEEVFQEIDDLQSKLQAARDEKLSRMQRAYELTLWHHLKLQAERRAIVRAMSKNLAEPWQELDPTEDDHPKPTTPRERLRALKAHPRSARGRR